MFWLNPNLEHIHYVGYSEDPPRLFEDMVKLGGEGVIFRRLNSIYQEGVRSHDWLKIKRFQKAVCQVVGYTEGNSRRSNHFGSLVLAQNGKYVGNVGSGFSDHELRKLTAHVKNCPKINPPFTIDGPYTAVKTSLTVQVR